MYDGPLRLTLPRSIKLVVYAGDLAVVIVVTHLDKINFMFDIMFERINRWMETVNLQLGKYKTKAVLTTSRKPVETINLKVGEQESRSDARCSTQFQAAS